MLKSPRYLALGAGLATFAGVLGGGAFAASAMTSNSAATAAAVSQAAPDSSQTGLADGTAAEESYLQGLATNLGIDEATLKAALQKTSLAEVQQMVTDGKLTQAQADQVTAEIQAGGDYFFGFGGPRGQGGPGGPGGPDHGDRAADDAALAQFLGIDAATLQQNERSGQSLAAIATAAGKSRDELKAFLTQAEAAELTAAVAAGKLTQAQADQIAADHASNLDQRIDATGPGPRGPMPQGQPPVAPSTTAPSGS